MDARSRFTVAIPTMNGARHLPATLRAIQAQELSGFDVLVCDDRSDDETVSIVQSELGDRARVVVNAERLGLARNWNRCVERCTTPYIAIVHQDDVLRPVHLARHLSSFESEIQPGLVASASTVIDEDGRPIDPSRIEAGGLGDRDRAFFPGEAIPWLVAGNPLRCSAVSLRVAAHQAVGGFNPALRYVVDWEFWVRLARAWPIAWCGTPTVEVRWHAASETHRFKKGLVDLDESRDMIERILSPLRDAGEADLDLERAAYRRLARAYLNRAYESSVGGDGLLARRCLVESLRLSPGILLSLGRDPRLALRLALVAAAPRGSARWLARPG